LASTATKLPIGQHRHPGDSRQHLFEQLQPLAAQLRSEGAQASDVAAGMSQAGDQPIANCIGWIGHDDGDRLSSVLGRLRRRRTAGRDDDIDIKLQQLRRQHRQALRLSLGVAVIDRYIFAFNVTERLQPLAECFQARLLHWRRTGDEKSHSWKPSLLRLG
jgi:hypothetical protein